MYQSTSGHTPGPLLHQGGAGRPVGWSEAVALPLRQLCAQAWLAIGYVPVKWMNSTE